MQPDRTVHTNVRFSSFTPGFFLDLIRGIFVTRLATKYSMFDSQLWYSATNRQIDRETN